MSSMREGSDSDSTDPSDTENLFHGQTAAWKSSEFERLGWDTSLERPGLQIYALRLSHQTLRATALMGAICVIFIFGLVYLQSLAVNAQKEVWIAYPVGKSDGPLVQLRLEKSNISEWIADHGKFSEDYTFRLDDQTLIPKKLLSSQETRYQAWFRRFYPQLEEVHTDGRYLDGDYLDTAAANMIHVDMRFHLSHCVLALRRYWDAKESGKHVCARDIDPDHIKHCLMSLDEWAFPEDGIAPKYNVWLEWVTQVCEYDH